MKDAGASDSVAKVAGQLISGATAAGIGAAVGSTAGAATGFNVDANNRQLHETEKQRIRQLANGDKQKEQRLSTAACALVKCYADFPEGSAEYAVFKAIADEGGKPEYTTERSLLSQQTDVTAGRNGVTYKLFQYGLGGQTLDGLKQADNTYQITTRVLGGGQAIGAAATAVAGTTITATGAATCAPSAGAGCLVAAGGAALTLYGIDQTKAGVTTLMDGTPSRTIGGAFVSQWLGISPEAAELVYGVAGLSPAVVEAYARNKAVNQTAKLNAATREANIGAKGGAVGAATLDDVLVLGRGLISRLEQLASLEEGRYSTVYTTDAKAIFKQNYSDIRAADKIIQYMDGIPTTFDEALQIGGQFSRAEVFIINQRKDLLLKTFRKFEILP